TTILHLGDGLPSGSVFASDGSETLAFPTVRYLVVEVDSTMSWQVDFGAVCKKVNYTAFAVRKLRSSLDEK
ncbi:hypothetical protein HHI36_016372, partial [Cryptolaemus montrouzieri]